jgi:hypothetical protein
MSQHIFSIVTLCLQRKNSNKKTLNKNCAKWERYGLEEKKKDILVCRQNFRPRVEGNRRGLK